MPDSDEHASDDWLQRLKQSLLLTDQTMNPGLRANLSCRMVDRKASLYLPPEMAELQPALLRYLHAVGSSNDITLVEDRRRVDMLALQERREQRPNDLAIGVSLLLKQTGLPGPAHSLSTPHMLMPDNAHIDMPTLIRIADQLHIRSKRVVFIPNRFLTGNFDASAGPMMGYACKTSNKDANITLCYFNATDFKALGYVTNNQFVLHVLLAGGSIRDPQIWSSRSTLTNSNFRCQVFKSPAPAQDFGLLYSTFYIDLERSMEDEKWWRDSEVADAEDTNAS